MIKQAISELFRRARLALAVILWGDLINGNLRHLRAMLAELEFISTHRNDMSKDEVILLIVGDISKPQTGMLHHLRHVLSSENWRIIAAEMCQAEILDAKRRIMKILRELRRD